jgi:multiple sugar transport system permease protein
MQRIGHKHSKMQRRMMWFGIVFAAIQVIGFLFFYLYPFILSIIKALSTRSNQFVKLFSSSTFKLALGNTFKFILIGLPLLYIFVVLMALGMNYMYKHRMKGRSLFLALHLVPMLIPSAVISFFIRNFFEQNGIVNDLLATMGCGPINWLDSSWAFVLFVLVFLWKNYGYCMIIMMGGFLSVPDETVEAAQIEGAGKFMTLRKIILPQIKSYTIFTLIMGIIGLFKMFRESYTLFGDYPHDSVYMMQNFLNNCFYSINYSRLAAASSIMITIFTVIVIAMLFWDKDWRDNV